MENILKHREKILYVFTAMFVGVLVMSLAGVTFSPQLVGAADADDDDTDTTTVTANTNEWAHVVITTNNITLSPDLVAADGGTSIGWANTTFTVGTNDDTGLTTAISTQNNALTGPGADINTVTETETLVAGTDGYGVRCHEEGAEPEVSCALAFDIADTTDDVHDITGTFAETGGAGENMQATLEVGAASVPTRLAGEYTDTITLTTTPKAN